MIVDTAGGSGELSITAGSGTSGKDLHLLAPTEKVTIDGEEKQVVDASTTYTIKLDGTTTLTDLKSKINELGGGVQASILNDGSSIKPFRLTLFNQSSGRAGAVQFDTSGVDFSVTETAQAKDALLLVGSPGAGGGLLASSSSNSFSEIVPDVSLTVRGAATAPVNVTVGATDSNLVTAVQDIVDAFNKLQQKLVEFTKFDETTNTSAVLQGDGAALRVSSDLTNFISRRYFRRRSIPIA